MKKEKRGPEFVLIKVMISIGLFVLISNYLFEVFFSTGVKLSQNTQAKLFGFLLIYLGFLYKLKLKNKNIFKNNFFYIKESTGYITSIVLIFFFGAFMVSTNFSQSLVSGSRTGSPNF